MPVPDFIRDPDFRKKLDDLTVAEFKDFKSTVDMLVKQGRDEKKLTALGEKIDKAEWIKQGNEQLASKFPAQRYQAPGSETRWGKIKTLTRDYIAAIKNMETFFGRLDGRDPRGMFTKMLMDPAWKQRTTARGWIVSSLMCSLMCRILRIRMSCSVRRSAIR